MSPTTLDPERDRVVSEHLGLVHHIAQRMSRRLRVAVEYDELVSAGTVGLLAALDAFDASRGRKFSTYAVPRIRGAILDELRRQDHAPRSIRRKARAIAAARRTLTLAAVDAPGDAAVAAHLGVDVQTLWRWERDVATADHDTIDALHLAGPRGTGGRARDGASADRGATLSAASLAAHEGADTRVEREERTAMLRDAIFALKDQQRVVLSLYYFEELPMAHIAQVLDVTESRVCQIHRKALRALHAALGTRIGRAA